MDELAQQVADRLKAERFVEVEASGRHVHLCREDVERLFGRGYRPYKSKGSVPAGTVCM